MNSISTYKLDGFEVLKLENAFVSVQVVPQCGAKIISLKDRRANREWLWRPGTEWKLFSNSRGDSFAKSPLTGIDECLPTIIASELNGRNIPDHGEVWSESWSVDSERIKEGKIRTMIELPISPFFFERTLCLVENQLIFEYRLENRSDRIEPYLWSFHPLFNILPGDRLHLQNTEDRWKTILSSDSSRLPVGESISWSRYPGVGTVVDPAFNSEGEPFYVKGFLKTEDGKVAIKREGTSESLLLEWDRSVNPYLGYFLNSKGWNGYFHWALEPTNFAHDFIDSFPLEEERGCSELSPREIREWKLWITLGD